MNKINNTVINYDAIGNPDKTINANGQILQLEWQGRQLTKVTMPNGNYETYAYNVEGLRTHRKLFSANGTPGLSFEYTWVGDMLVGYVRHNAANGNQWTVKYHYDDFGEVTAFTLQTNNDAPSTRYFTKNLQGDIIGVHWASSTSPTNSTFEYDAWGAVTVTSGGTASLAYQLSGLRYRGYQYDYETGLYYNQQRYYNPSLGRWINADSLFDLTHILGVNLYTYCGNDPINYVDFDGRSRQLNGDEFYWTVWVKETFDKLLAPVYATLESLIPGFFGVINKDALTILFMMNFASVVHLDIIGVLDYIDTTREMDSERLNPSKLLKVTETFKIKNYPGLSGTWNVEYEYFWGTPQDYLIYVGSMFAGTELRDPLGETTSDILWWLVSSIPIVGAMADLALISYESYSNSKEFENLVMLTFFATISNKALELAFDTVYIFFPVRVTASKGLNVVKLWDWHTFDWLELR